MEYARGYDDEYGGQPCENGADLASAIEEVGTGAFAALNIPVWIDLPDTMAGADCRYCVEYGERVECSHRLKVGVFMPRHGRCTIYYADDYTAEDVVAIRETLMRVWAGRADTGFARHSFARSEAS
jgi:hypothetical protein